MKYASAAAALLLALTQGASAFSSAPSRNAAFRDTSLAMAAEDGADRRAFLTRAAGLALGGAGFVGAQVGAPAPADATVYLDPAMYGDQELRLAAIASLREAVRRAILQKPDLAPAFYELALMDGLSYDFKSKAGGPDGKVVSTVLSSDDKSPFVADLQEACYTLINASKALKKYTAITIADAVALGGVEAVNSVGGPELSIQLGRTDAVKGSAPSTIPVNLLDGSNPARVAEAFRSAGLTEREMTALLGCLLTLKMTQKGRASEDWKKSTRGQFREPGKIGRMSEFKRLTDEDIAAMEEDDDEGSELTDNVDVYIAETFGARDQVFGQKVGKDIDQKTFNKYLGELNKFTAKKGGSGDLKEFGWIGTLLLDKENPTSQAWINKYGTSNLNYQKDLGIAYNAITQLGAEFTGGKYESLLKNRPRKTLNDE
eukprot:CAMPEP_0183291512 /NCGR_PEP_ID=MMETSP0160_2-20130417/906_1 /TAXON_ID=2839 ORGANISM="Odontella Sinensis, Strain Grunow 1884" /NCGR_SAMPLE_ID=MMETSP0160_2 /ASSEMBLY_ACC=CAM_ASM_000250 /LENGTH=429 /DNA_ID=CAMNT_0025452331 /DNA_START=15 /DNA_END=1304 /DNA_ORIENTATION=+